MSPKSVSKTSSFRAVPKVARRPSFEKPKPNARATSLRATEELQTLTKTSSYRLLPRNLSNLVDPNHSSKNIEDKVPKHKPKKLDPEIEDAKHRVAQRFFIKRTKRFSGFQGYLLQCPVAERSRIVNSFLNIKNSAKSKISQALPKTEALTKMTSTMMNTLMGYFGLSPRSSGERAAVKRTRDDSTKHKTYMNGLKLTSIKKNEVNTGDSTFAQPKIYDCEYCIDKKFFHHIPYFKHLKSHNLKDIVRCRGCNIKFDLKQHDINDMRRHEVFCSPRVPLK